MKDKIRQIIIDNLMDDCMSAFGVSTATQGKGAEPLTIEHIQKAIELVFPVLYYQLDTYVQKGNMYLVKEREKPEGFLASHPEYVIMHPEELDRVKELVAWRTLKPLDEYKEKE